MSRLRMVPETVNLAEDSFNDGWDRVGDPISTPADCLKLSDGADATEVHCLWAAGATHTGSRLQFTLTALPPVFLIQLVTYYIRLKRDTSNFQGQEWKPFVVIGGTGYDFAAYAHADAIDYADFVYTAAVSPATSNPWTRAELNAMLMGVACRNLDGSSARGVFVAEMYLLVDVLGQPFARDPVLDVASRILRERSIAQELISIRASYFEGLDVGVNDILPVTHMDGPMESGYGWGARRWQQIQGQVRKKTTSPLGFVRCEILDERPFRCLYRDTAWPRTGANLLIGDGRCIVTTGAQRIYTRSTPAWIQDPGSLLAVFISPDQECYEPNGEVFEGAHSNYVRYSAFQAAFDGAHGWTKIGAGTNGSDVTAEPVGAPTAGSPGVFWDPSTGITQCALVQAGNPHTADVYLLGDQTDTIAGGTKVPVSFWYSNPVDGQEPQVSLKRSVDGFYYDFVTHTWGASLVWTSLDPGTPGVVRRWDSDQLVNVGGSATKLQPIVGLATGIAVNLQESRFHCCQIGESYVYGNPIVTTTATVTTVAGKLRVLEDATHPVVDVARGEFACDVIPYWRTSDIGSAVKLVFHHVYDANNLFAIYYDGATTSWVGQVVSGGVSYGATVLDGGVQLRRKIRLVFRRTGADGELLKTPHSATMFKQADGESFPSSSSDVVYVQPIVTVPANFWIGVDYSGTLHFDGVIRMHTVLQDVFSDAVCARLP